MWNGARHDPRMTRVVPLSAVCGVARSLERANPPRSARATPYAAVVRGLAWRLRVGGAWRALPSGLVHWRTAYGWLRRWLALGLFEALLRHVAARRRGPQARAAPGRARHPVRRVHPRARPPRLRSGQEGLRAQRSE